jgi:hypothetical protein
MVKYLDISLLLDRSRRPLGREIAHENPRCAAPSFKERAPRQLQP